MQDLRFSYKGFTGVKLPDGCWGLISQNKNKILAVKGITRAIDVIEYYIRIRKIIEGSITWIK